MGGLPDVTDTAMYDADQLITSHLINCVLLNARSIVNKLPELSNLLSASNLGLICITETWLNPSVTDRLVCDGKRYSVFRKDRSASIRGGGVCILVNNYYFNAVQVPVPDQYSHLEMVVIDICNSDNNFRVFLCYRPPSGDSDVDALRYSIEMCNCIEYLYPNNATVLVCGDFNSPNVKWNDSDISFSCKSTCSGTFVNLFVKFAFSQFVSEPTRLNTSSQNGSVLDLVLCNDVNFVHDTHVDVPFSTSDHSMVKFKIINRLIPVNVNFTSNDFNRANWVGIFEYLNNNDFDVALASFNDVDSRMNCFYSILNDCISANVPVVKSNCKTNTVRYPKHIRRCLLKKTTAWRVYRQFRTDAALNKYKKLAAESRFLIYEHTLRRENKIVNSGNISSFYRHCNRKFNCRSIIGPIKDHNGSLNINPVEKANMFQNSFSSFYTIDNDRTPCSV